MKTKKASEEEEETTIEPKDLGMQGLFCSHKKSGSSVT